MALQLLRRSAGSRCRLHEKVVGRRRVERALRLVSVYSGGDLPPLSRERPAIAGGPFVCFMPSSQPLSSAQDDSVRSRSATTIPSASAQRKCPGVNVTPAKLTGTP